MKRTLLAAWLVITFVSCTSVQTNRTETRLWSLADRKQTAEILGTRDGYIERLSPFDRQLILGTEEDRPVDELLAHFREQAKDWPENDLPRMRRLAEEAFKKMSAYPLNLPDGVLIALTVGEDFGEAAYTRANLIVLPETLIRGPDAALDRLLIHETFHILTRYNPALRERLFRIIGFYPCQEPGLPPGLDALRLTNPDDYDNDYCIELAYRDDPGQFIPLVYAKRPYDPARGTGVFDYLVFGLLMVTIRDGQTTPIYDGREPVIVPPNELPGYYKKIGFNTDYIISPEEIMAENFVLLINNEPVRTPRIIMEMKNVLLDEYTAGR
ncbi:MAG TPA: hypothetical protein ENN69_02575 [Spirochaetia bacterium]|mgnify:CR=1 FL=1|nr:hypothetical protein [Spirochaetia bacterium]